jgi:hypothetical protein
MRTITRRRSHSVTGTTTGRRSTSNGRPSNPRVRPQLVSDAVIAGYIHEISVRHRHGDASRTTAAVAGPAEGFVPAGEADLPSPATP